MKKWKQIVSFLFLCILFFIFVPVVHAEEKDDSKTRIELAKEMGLEDSVDEEGYLFDSFYDGKSDYELTTMKVAPLVRSLSEEELQACIERLKAGTSLFEVTYYKKVTEGYDIVGYFEVDGTFAYCIEHSVATPPAGTPTSDPIESTNENLRKVLYYGKYGPADRGHSWAKTTLCASRANGDTNGTMGTATTAVWNDIIAQPAPPSSFKVWIVHTKHPQLNYDTQDLAYWTQEQSGSLTMKKSSGNTTITANNSCYSLEGAEYSVYSNSSCTVYVDKLITKADGTSNTLTLDAGTYYVQETKAPKGYALNSNVITVIVTGGETTTFTAVDMPQMDPVGILLGKVDAETNKNKPQGSATLQGAQFTVKYYDVLLDNPATDPAKVGKVPLKTWIFETDKDGFIYYGTEWFVSGDEFYKNSSGTVSIPLGTITIQETREPEGYQINKEVYVRQITGNGKTENVTTYNYPTIPENILKLTLVKKAEDTKKVLSGAKFEHVKPDGTKEVLTTDANGKLEFKGLSYGTHSIRETVAPTGYVVNGNIVKFTVSKGNVITLTSTADVSKGKIEFQVTADGNAALTVYDKPAPYTIRLLKENENEKVLEGAEFTLYSDKACTKVVQSGKTDSKGILNFTGLIFGTEYYLKETKAPQGYRIPVNKDGSQIVYKIKVVNNNGATEYYVNDVKHTSSTGDFAITGTSEKTVHLNVINYTGVQMPETGTSTTLLMSLVGMSGLTIYTGIEKRKAREEFNGKI